MHFVSLGSRHAGCQSPVSTSMVQTAPAMTDAENQMAQQCLSRLAATAFAVNGLTP